MSNNARKVTRYRMFQQNYLARKTIGSRRNAILLFIELVVPALVVILSVDLLYLYYTGSWYDPIQFIEWSEVALLYLFALGGVFWLIVKIRWAIIAERCRIVSIKLKNGVIEVINYCRLYTK